MPSLVTVADALLQLIRQRSVRSSPEAAEPRTGTLQAPTRMQPRSATRSQRGRRAGTPSDLWSLGSSHLSQVSCGSGKSGLGGVFVDMVGDGGQGAAEFGWGLGLIGGGEWDEEPVVRSEERRVGKEGRSRW